MRYRRAERRSSEWPFITDWFAVSLRWLFLLGLITSLAVGGKLLALPSLLLAMLAGWNIAATILSGLSLRLTNHREINVAIDLLVAAAYFVLSGGFGNPGFWIVFLPLITATLYFEIFGAVISAILMAAVQISVTIFHTINLIALLIMGVSSLFTFAVAGFFGYISVKLVNTLRGNRLKEQESQQKKSQLEADRFRVIYSLTSTLLSTLNYQRVLESALDLSLSALGDEVGGAADDRLICAVLLFSKNETLEVGSARRLTTADLRVVLHGREGAVAQSIDQDKPVLVQDVNHDPELPRFVSLRTCREVYCFPLRSGLSAYGILLFGHPQPGFFTHERCDILDILGSQAVIAIQNARLYQDVVDERERMVEAQEEARKKLARDLHDGPTQSVSAIAMRVNMAQRILSKNPKAAEEELGRIEELARRTTKEIRHMLFTLRPLVLESQGLVAALQSMAGKMKETYSQNVIISVEEKILADIEVGKQGVIFFIVEEALNNARKHARANHIWVSLRPIEKGLALLEIQDDGVGFDVAAVNRSYDQRGSLGMVNLSERSELVNGVLNIQSAPGKGTRVQVFIPLTVEAADRLHHASAARNL